MSNESIAIIAGVLYAVLKLAEKVYDDWRLDKSAKKIADKVEAVKTDAATSAGEIKTALQRTNEKQGAQTKAFGDRLNDISEQIDGVHALTNGMKTELVNEVRKSSYAAGVKSETDKENKKDGG